MFHLHKYGILQDDSLKITENTFTDLWWVPDTGTVQKHDTLQSKFNFVYGTIKYLLLLVSIIFIPIKFDIAQGVFGRSATYCTVQFSSNKFYTAKQKHGCHIPIFSRLMIWKVPSYKIAPTVSVTCSWCKMKRCFGDRVVLSSQDPMTHAHLTLQTNFISTLIISGSFSPCYSFGF